MCQSWTSLSGDDVVPVPLDGVVLPTPQSILAAAGIATAGVLVVSVDAVFPLSASLHDVARLAEDLSVRQFSIKLFDRVVKAPPERESLQLAVDVIYLEIVGRSAPRAAVAELVEHVLSTLRIASAKGGVHRSCVCEGLATTLPPR